MGLNTQLAAYTAQLCRAFVQGKHVGQCARAVRQCSLSNVSPGTAKCTAQYQTRAQASTVWLYTQCVRVAAGCDNVQVLPRPMLSRCCPRRAPLQHWVCCPTPATCQMSVSESIHAVLPKGQGRLLCDYKCVVLQSSGTSTGRSESYKASLWV